MQIYGNFLNLQLSWRPFWNLLLIWISFKHVYNINIQYSDEYQLRNSSSEPFAFQAHIVNVSVQFGCHFEFGGHFVLKKGFIWWDMVI